MNYRDDLNSLFTLVHEIGHSVHSYLSRKNQPYLYSHYKIFVAEVASTLNEQLLMNYMINSARNKEERLFLIHYNLEQFRTTVFRQTMFAEFEKAMHEMVENNDTLTNDSISKVYYDLNLKYYGKAVQVDEDIALEWARVPHFYSNFYVYKYATGFCAASAICNNILTKGDSYLKDYLNFLKSGGSQFPLVQLKNAGVDMEDEKSIEKGMDLFKNLILKLKEEK